MMRVELFSISENFKTTPQQSKMGAIALSSFVLHVETFANDTATLTVVNSF